MPGPHMSSHPRVRTSLGQASLFAPPDNLGTVQTLKKSEVSWTQITVKYSNIPIHTIYRLEMSPPRALLFGQWHDMKGWWYWKVLWWLYFCLSQLLVQWSFSAFNDTTADCSLYRSNRIRFEWFNKFLKILYEMSRYYFFLLLFKETSTVIRILNVYLELLLIDFNNQRQ